MVLNRDLIDIHIMDACLKLDLDGMDLSIHPLDVIGQDLLLFYSHHEGLD